MYRILLQVCTPLVPVGRPARGSTQGGVARSPVGDEDVLPLCRVQSAGHIGRYVLTSDPKTDVPTFKGACIRISSGAFQYHISRGVHFARGEMNTFPTSCLVQHTSNTGNEFSLDFLVASLHAGSFCRSRDPCRLPPLKTAEARQLVAPSTRACQKRKPSHRSVVSRCH